MTAGIFAEITKNGKSIALVVAGNDHEINQAATLMRHMTPFMEKAEGALICPLTWSAIVQISQTFNGSEITGIWCPQEKLRNWIIREFTWRHTPSSATPSWPEGLTPRPYQLDAAAMIGSAGKFLLYDDAGLGKTCSAILGLKVRQICGLSLWPMVVVAPSWDILDSWAREIAMWAPEFPEPVMYGGTGRATGQDILLTTYATARLDAADAKGPLVKLKARTVISDEAHAIRNQASLQSQALRRISSHAENFIALTGTPVVRDTGNIYPILAAMEPESYPSRERFVKRYLDTADDQYGERVEGLKALAEPEFHAVLQGQFRRVAKSDVLSELPPKQYSIRRVELPAEWRRAYDTLEQDMLADLPDGQELPVMSTLAQLTRLSQLASSAFDVEITEEPSPLTGLPVKHYQVTLKPPSWKVDALLGILAERPGQPVAVFANSAQLILIAGEACKEAGYHCGFIVGGQAKGSRRKAISDFQAGELDVILATAGAGGLGITLTAAGTVVMLQRSWQLDLAIQPEDRAHRIGNEHDFVEIIDIISKSTVDSRVRAALKEKNAQLSQLVRDPRLVRELLGGLKG